MRGSVGGLQASGGGLEHLLRHAENLITAERLEDAVQWAVIGQLICGLIFFPRREKHHAGQKLGSPPLQLPAEGRAVELGHPEVAHDHVVGPA